MAPDACGFKAGETGVTFVGAFASAEAAHLATPDTKVFAVFYSGLDSYYVPVEITGSDVSIKLALYLIDGTMY